MKYKYLLGWPVLFLFLVISLAACKSKKKASLSGNEAVDISDFIAFFQDTPLPLNIYDTTLNKKISDSLLIGQTVFHSFVPDSVLGKDFGKSFPHVYPLGKAREKGKETYLFIRAGQGQRKIAYVLCFDKNNRYLNALPLVRTGTDNAGTMSYAVFDKKFQLTTYREKKTGSGAAEFKRNVYIYNSASNEFTLIVTEPGEELASDVQNPIDTLAQKNKFSGDYQADKKNFISFRDSHKPSEIVFFTHFEKDKGACKGELKGTARFLSPKLAQYKENGNPCTLQFSFGPTAVTMKEVEGCGSYRDIKCFFDGTYPRKKKKETKGNHSKTENTRR